MHLKEQKEDKVIVLVIMLRTRKKRRVGFFSPPCIIETFNLVLFSCQDYIYNLSLKRELLNGCVSFFYFEFGPYIWTMRWNNNWQQGNPSNFASLVMIEVDLIHFDVLPHLISVLGNYLSRPNTVWFVLSDLVYRLGKFQHKLLSETTYFKEKLQLDFVIHTPYRYCSAAVL
jgi:hypothetical protein